MFGLAFEGAAAEHERADAVRIAEGEHADAGDDGDDRVAAFAALVDLLDGREDVGGLGGDDAAAREGVCEDVEHDLAVGGGVEVTAVVLTDVFDDLLHVGEVAVVGEDDAVGAVDVEGLGFGYGGATGGGVADVADTHVA